MDNGWCCAGLVLVALGRGWAGCHGALFHLCLSSAWSCAVGDLPQTMGGATQGERREVQSDRVVQK